MRRRRFLAGKLALAVSVWAAIGCGDNNPPPFTTCDSGVLPPYEAGSPDQVVLVDAGPPPIDGAFSQDVYTSDCPGGGLTNVFAVTEQNTLYSFAPKTATFARIGTLNCPVVTAGATPFSMAVSRQGVAYVLFNDGTIFRVSTIDASCSSTAFQPGQNGFTTFGMGYTTDHTGPAETLFVGDFNGGGLAIIDAQSYVLTPGAMFSRPLPQPELTGTADGRLFAFYKAPDGVSSGVAELDKVTGQILADNPLPTVMMGNGWAFAFWGGDFYLFTAPTGSGVVTRFRPTDGSVTQVATLSETIIGAGVSTCAPP